MESADQAYIQYLRDNGASQEQIAQAMGDAMRARGMNDDEIRGDLAYQKYVEGQNPGTPKMLQSEDPWYKRYGRGLVKGLDYTSNLGRAGVFGLTQAVTGNNYGINLHDALTNNTPSTDELLRRGGMPEGDIWPENPYFPSARTALGFAGDVLADPVTYVPFVGWGKAAATMEKYLPKAGKAINKAGRIATRGVGDAMEGAGKYSWKSGMKAIDTEAMKYGKEPVSDVLMKHGITGTEEQIYNKMDKLGVDLLNKRNDILKRASGAGAEVDLPRAMQPARDFLGEMRRLDDPTMEAAMKQYDSAIDTYMTRAPQEPKTIFKPLDEARAYDAPTLSSTNGNKSSLYRKDAHPKGPEHARGRGVFNEPVINDSVDKVVSLPVGGEYIDVPRVPGPTPEQVSSWKSNAYNRVGDTAYKEAMLLDKGRQFQKELSRGLKGATEESVGKTLGAGAQQEVKTLNDELGRILTAKDRQLMEAAKARGKNYFTSVDGMLLPVSGKATIVKKAADLAKMPVVRTNVGKGLVKAGQLPVETLWRQILLQPIDRDGMDETMIPYRLPDKR